MDFIPSHIVSELSLPTRDLSMYILSKSPQCLLITKVTIQALLKTICKITSKWRSSESITKINVLICSLSFCFLTLMSLTNQIIQKKKIASHNNMTSESCLIIFLFHNRPRHFIYLFLNYAPL